MYYVTYKVSRPTIDPMEEYIRLMTGLPPLPELTGRFNTIRTDNPHTHPLLQTPVLTEFYPTLADYYTFNIPKASGGFRTITAPQPQVANIQRDILNFLQNDLHLLPHDAAHAFVKERSIVTAIKRHQENESMYFLKVDIRDFFPSCTVEFLTEQLFQIYPLCLYGRFVDSVIGWGTLHNALPQGAPTSPLLSNLAMIPIDTHITNSLQGEQDFVYTRYADDILISSKHPFRFKSIIQKLEYIFTQHNAPFVINHAKTRYGTRRGRNWNLGIMLNKDNKMTIGHRRREKLRAQLFSTLQSVRDHGAAFRDVFEQLDGYIAHALNVDPNINDMIEKVERKVNYSLAQARRRLRE